MSSQVEIVRVALAALLAGMAVPLLVQLFLTLRAVSRASETLSGRLDETGRQLGSLLTELRNDRRHPDAGALIAGALVPAVVAGIRAFRANSDGRAAAEPSNAEVTS